MCPSQGYYFTWQNIKFEVSSLSHSRDISWGVKFYNESRNPDYTPFRHDFPPAGWDWLWSTYVPNLKSLDAPVMKL